MPLPAIRKQRGFTLIELMITVSISGVLASIALPSFESQLQRARRSDVLVATLQVQAAQERFRGNGANYGSLAEIGVANLSTAKHYALQIASSDADGYQLLASAIGVQARDASCRHMKLSSTGANLAYASGPDTSVANPPDLNRRCWNL